MSEQNDGGQNSSAASKNNKDLPLKSDGTVDIDKIRLKLLIICRAKPPLDTVAGYLIRRGWETVVTREMVDAFKIVSTFKPDFVMVSVNIQSPKLSQLPTVLYQTFKVPVAIFGESLNTKTMKGLQTIVSNYKMPGAVSGPSVHRRLKQILQSIHSPEVEAVEVNTEDDSIEKAISAAAREKKKSPFGKPSASSDDGENDSEMMRFSHDENEKSSGIFSADDESTSKTTKNKATNAQVGGHSAENGNDDDEQDLDLDALVAQYGIAKIGGSKKDEDFGGVVSKDEDSDLNGNFGKVKKPGLNESDDQNANAAISGEPPAKKKSTIYQKSSNSHPSSPAPNKPGYSPISNEQKKLNDYGEGTTAKAKVQSESEALSGAAGVQHNQAQAHQGAASAGVRQSGETSNQVFKAIQEVAKKSTLPIENEPQFKRTVFECTVVSVKLSGKTIYAMIFVEGAVHDEIQFISRFHANLNENLRKKVLDANVSEPVRFSQHFNNDILMDSKEKPEAWAFSLRSGMGHVHFILVNSEDYKAQITPGQDKNKAQIAASDLVVDLPVGVDVFLYLPKNDKYFLYLKPESAIAQDQKDRVTEKKAKLYIAKEDIEAFKESLKRNKTLELVINNPKKNKKAA